MTNPDTSSTDTQMNGQSLDIAEQRRKELEQLFPGIGPGRHPPIQPDRHLRSVG